MDPYCAFPLLDHGVPDVIWKVHSQAELLYWLWYFRKVKLYLVYSQEFMYLTK